MNATNATTAPAYTPATGSIDPTIEIVLTVALLGILVTVILVYLVMLFLVRRLIKVNGHRPCAPGACPRAPC